MPNPPDALLVASHSVSEAASGFRATFHRLEAEIRAVPDRDLIPVNVDVLSAITTVLGRLPSLEGLRAELATLPGFDLARFAKLHDYALALGHTHFMHRIAAGRSDAPRKLASELATIRDVFRADAMALASRRLLEGVRLTKLRRSTGFQDLAFEVLALVILLREKWAEIENRTAIQLEELDYASELAGKLIVAVGRRAHAPAAIDAAAELRQRAFTLLAATYEEVRRGVAYLRWHEKDADFFAPSLFAQRRKRRRKPKPPNEPESNQPEPKDATSPDRAGA